MQLRVNPLRYKITPVALTVTGVFCNKNVNYIRVNKMFWKRFIGRLFDWNGDGELDMVEQGAKTVYENAKALTAEEETVLVEVSEEGIALAQELADPTLDEFVNEEFAEFVEELDFYYSGYGDIEDVAKTLIEAGYDDIIDLEYMDDEELVEVLISVGLDPDDFSF